MQAPINVAVVGAGYWGPNLIRNFNSLSDCNLKVVCDRDAERLNHIQRQYPNIEINLDYQMVVTDPSIHAVVIATPVQTHYKLAYQSLSSGKHTFIEKPMASSVQECLKLNKLARKKKINLDGWPHLYLFFSGSCD